MVELEGQVLRHHVLTVVGALFVQASAVLQEDHDQLVSGDGQGYGVHITTEPCEQLAVHRHRHTILPELGWTNRADTPVSYRADTP